MKDALGVKKKPRHYQGFRKERLKGLEPSTSCMATSTASDIASTFCVQIRDISALTTPQRRESDARKLRWFGAGFRNESGTNSSSLRPHAHVLSRGSTTPSCPPAARPQPASVMRQLTGSGEVSRPPLRRVAARCGASVNRGTNCSAVIPVPVSTTESERARPPEALNHANRYVTPPRLLVSAPWSLHLTAPEALTTGLGAGRSQVSVCRGRDRPVPTPVEAGGLERLGERRHLCPAMGSGVGADGEADLHLLAA